MLILFSAVASTYYAVSGIIKPETILVFNKANMPRTAIKLSSLVLGVGGILLLLPQTFKVGASILMTHSMITITCFILIKDYRGGFLESIFLLIPIVLIGADYPIWVIEKVRILLN